MSRHLKQWINHAERRRRGGRSVGVVVAVVEEVVRNPFTTVRQPEPIIKFARRLAAGAQHRDAANAGGTPRLGHRHVNRAADRDRTVPDRSRGPGHRSDAGKVGEESPRGDVPPLLSSVSV
jgi:hypothetical protein